MYELLKNIPKDWYSNSEFDFSLLRKGYEEFEKRLSSPNPIDFTGYDSIFLDYLRLYTFRHILIPFWTNQLTDLSKNPYRLDYKLDHLEKIKNIVQDLTQKNGDEITIEFMMIMKDLVQSLQYLKRTDEISAICEIVYEFCKYVNERKGTQKWKNSWANIFLRWFPYSLNTHIPEYVFTSYTTSSQFITPIMRGEEKKIEEKLIEILSQEYEQNHRTFMQIFYEEPIKNEGKPIFLNVQAVSYSPSNLISYSASKEDFQSLEKIQKEWKKLWRGPINPDRFFFEYYWSFNANPEIKKAYKEMYSKAENEVRKEMGLPFIGQGWIGETILSLELKELFYDLEVQTQASPSFLGQQRYDIYLPKFKIAFEFQGAQHFKPVDVFGGEKGFQDTLERDERKRNLSRQNDVFLIEVLPGYDLKDILDTVATSGRIPEYEKYYPILGKLNIEEFEKEKKNLSDLKETSILKSRQIREKESKKREEKKEKDRIEYLQKLEEYSKNWLNRLDRDYLIADFKLTHFRKLQIPEDECLDLVKNLMSRIMEHWPKLRHDFEEAVKIGIINHREEVKNELARRDPERYKDSSQVKLTEDYPKEYDQMYSNLMTASFFNFEGENDPETMAQNWASTYHHFIERVLRYLWSTKQYDDGIQVAQWAIENGLSLKAPSCLEKKYAKKRDFSIWVDLFKKKVRL